jgi:RNA polymerase sigma factor (sigma-70 family)
VDRTDQVVRIGLVHPLRTWLDSLECLLEPRNCIDVVVAHTDPEWVRGAVERGDVDLVLISLDPDVGAEPVQTMRHAGPPVDVVVISDSDDTTFLHDVVHAGARGWLSSDSSLEHLLEVIHGVRRGETWVPPRQLTLLVDELLESEHARTHEPSVLAALSTRERQILELLAQGLTRQQIAEQLFLSQHTVRTHITNLLRKLNVHSTLAAVALARATEEHGDTTSH